MSGFSANHTGSDILCDPTKFYYYNSDSGDIYCKKSKVPLYGLFNDENLNDKYDDWGGSKIIGNFLFLLTDGDYLGQATAIGIDEKGIYYHFAYSDAICFSTNNKLLEEKLKQNQKIIKILSLSNGFFRSYEDFQKNGANIEEFLKIRKDLGDDIGLELVI